MEYKKLLVYSLVLSLILTIVFTLEELIPPKGEMESTITVWKGEYLEFEIDEIEESPCEVFMSGTAVCSLELSNGVTYTPGNSTLIIPVEQNVWGKINAAYGNSCSFYSNCCSITGTWGIGRVFTIFVLWLMTFCFLTIVLFLALLI
jgi:hypothetical protein